MVSKDTPSHQTRVFEIEKYPRLRDEKFVRDSFSNIEITRVDNAVDGSEILGKPVI